MPQRLHVYTNLVRSSCLDPHLDESERAISRRQPLNYFDVRYRGSSVRTASGHACAPDEIARDRQVDRHIVLRQCSVDERDVDLCDAAHGEHLAELAVGDVVLGDNDGAAGLLVEAMNDSWPQLAADGR